MRPTDADLQRILREAAATYAALIGVAGLPPALSRRVIAGRMFRANATANALEAVQAVETRPESV